jgi:PEP-CTERM motif-containing protein
VRSFCAGVLGFAGVLLWCVPASAVLLAPGTTVPLPTGNLLDPATDPPVGQTLLAELVGVPFSSPTFFSGTPAFSGTFTQKVYDVPGVGILFEYFITSNAKPPEDPSSSIGIDSVAVSNFGGFVTDVNFVAGDGPEPDSATRSAAPGANITFDYSDLCGDTPICPGTTADVLYVQTNATDFQLGGTITFGGVDPDSISHEASIPNIYQPLTAGVSVPEPGTLLLLGFGLAALGVGRRRSFLAR